MEKLISMRLFVEKKRCTTISTTDISEVLTSIFKYEMFLRQILELWMFVPCKLLNGIWVVLEEPIWQVEFEKGKVYSENLIKQSEEYQEAKERVLFKGFEFKGEYDFSFIFKYKGLFPTMIPKMNIELLANRYKDIELTPTAQKQIS